MSALSTSTAASGSLYIVSTPIGNLADITYRAVDVLRSVSLIVAEDTRHSRTLLAKYDISTPVASYHEHNEARGTPALVRRLLGGESVAMISDAGTPLLSDPGARLVRAAGDAGVPVIPVPGASALLAALVASGIAADHFAFLGFLPRKGEERVRALREVDRATTTTVIYESPQRVKHTLDDLIAVGCGDREAAIARELTKKFEEIKRATVAELREGLSETVRGEIVLVIAGGEARAPSEDDARALAEQLRLDGAPPRAIVNRLIQELGLARNLAYRLAHERSVQGETD